MAKYTFDELEAIIQEQMPGHQVVEPTPAVRHDAAIANGPLRDAAADANADAVSSDLDTLRGDTAREETAYVREASAPAYAPVADAAEGAPADERKQDTIIAVRPARAHSTYDGVGYRTKAVVISEGRIIGRQG